MAIDNHTHTGAKGDGGNVLSPDRLNVGNGALVVDKGKIGAGTATPASSLEVRSSANDYPPVMHVEYSGTDATDKIAIQGASAPRPDFGTGGSFRGGCTGIIARAEARGGTGERVGGEFWAQYGRATYAIKATTFGSNDPESGVHIAGYFHADQEQNHGDFWAGYFLGRVHISENVGIGTREPAAKLHVRGNVKIAGQDSTLSIENPAVPKGSDDVMGEKGQIAWDENFIYIKTQAGEKHVWKRAALESW
ncbi:MAG TPA: hypothetical protein VLX68_09240 [Chitinivibrionales bacterium]|nr:hypothetical protein [Chitinivibrionales bacterium]